MKQRKQLGGRGRDAKIYAKTKIMYIDVILVGFSSLRQTAAASVSISIDDTFRRTTLCASGDARGSVSLSLLSAFGDTRLWKLISAWV